MLKQGDHGLRFGFEMRSSRKQIVVRFCQRNRLRHLALLLLQQPSQCYRPDSHRVLSQKLSATKDPHNASALNRRTRIRLSLATRGNN